MSKQSVSESAAEAKFHRDEAKRKKAVERIERHTQAAAAEIDRLCKPEPLADRVSRLCVRDIADLIALGRAELREACDAVAEASDENSGPDALETAALSLLRAERFLETAETNARQAAGADKEQEHG